VTQSLSHSDTRQREFDGLIEALEKYSLKKGLILTESDEGDETITVGRKKYHIHIRVLWKWLVGIN